MIFIMYEKHKERVRMIDFIGTQVRYFLLNRNRLDNDNNFECNIFEYYYDAIPVIINLHRIYTTNTRLL